MNVLQEINQATFSESQYFKEEHLKTQIYLHHTAGSSNPFMVFRDWEKSTERIATCIVIGGKTNKYNAYKDGAIVQGFSSKFYAYHLGLKKEIFDKHEIPYQSLDKISVGVEICNWGWVTKTDKGWETYVGTVIPENEVVEYATPFKGRKHYHRYTDAQIESVRKLLLLWIEKYQIDKNYSDKIWDIDLSALNGLSGIYTHNSVRADKCDVHPMPEMIQMLKSL